MRKNKPRKTRDDRRPARNRLGGDAKGQIVLKLMISVDATGQEPVAYPDVFMLADEQGWEYLSKLCRRRARRARALVPQVDDLHPDPEDHDHLSMYIDQELSDRVDLRLGTLTAANRDVVFKRYGISPGKVFRQSLIVWCDLLKQEAQERERAAKPFCGE